MSSEAGASAAAAAGSSASAATPAPSASSRAQRVIIVPGNGCGKIERANWYAWVRDELTKLGYDVRMRSMPDPNQAKETIWIPFILNELGADEHSILIGHSSGAEAGMRLLENNKLKGLVLVSACHTDLGEPNETIAGYYSRPWQWETIRSNAKWIIQFHSRDDPFIPLEGEADFVAKNLQTEFIVHDNRGHYMEKTMPGVVEVIKKKAPPSS